MIFIQVGEKVPTSSYETILGLRAEKGEGK